MLISQIFEDMYNLLLMVLFVKLSKIDISFWHEEISKSSNNLLFKLFFDIMLNSFIFDDIFKFLSNVCFSFFSIVSSFSIFFGKVLNFSLLSLKIILYSQIFDAIINLSFIFLLKTIWNSQVFGDINNSFSFFFLLIFIKLKLYVVIDNGILTFFISFVFIVGIFIIFNSFILDEIINSFLLVFFKFSFDKQISQHFELTSKFLKSNLPFNSLLILISFIIFSSQAFDEI